MWSGIAAPALSAQPNHKQQQSASRRRLAASIYFLASKALNMAVAVSLIGCFYLMGEAHAQTPSPALTDEQKIDSFVGLLQDPHVRAWLEARKVSPAPTETARETRSGIEGWEAALRARLESIITAVPFIPAEISAATHRVHEEARSHHYGSVFLIFGLVVGVGLVTEWFYRKRQKPQNDGLTALFSMAIFVLVTAVVFFAVEWPPLSRLTLFAYLLAFIGYRVGASLNALVVPAAPLKRAQILLAITMFSIATTNLAQPLGVQPAVSDAMAYGFSVIILALALEAVWSTSGREQLSKAVISACIIAVWLLWCLQLRGLFWLGLYALLLPGILRATARLALGFSSGDAFSLRNVLIARGARAVIVAIAAAWLAFVWHMTPDGIGHSNPVVTALFYGLMKSVVIVLLADLCWHLARTWIDGTLAEASDTVDVSSADLARRARYRTLLPIFRNALAVLIIVMAGLIVLSQLGVEVVPLIAGAGIFGVAIGFGSQTLVKDIISGVFYMFDDAFRIGEYIQAKDYKGTVEGFSLRSVRLRHHRGPVYTVPFGDLGAVQNMSRDWGVVKFRISVSHSADVETVRKLTKKIGAALLVDPDLGPLFIEPLKMKGIEEFADYGMVLSFGMMLRPSPMQSFIRRRANLLLREAFLANGIEFAVPSVQVDADEKGNAAAAATSLRAQQLKAAAAAQ